MIYDTTKTVSGLPSPHGWYVLDRKGDTEGTYGMAWRRVTGEALTVIESIAPKEDGHNWLHVSLSKPNKKMPTYEDIQTLRKLFIGEDRECYMIFPTKERYVNIHPGVVHLYCCLDQSEGVLPHMEGKIGEVLGI